MNQKQREKMLEFDTIKTKLAALAFSQRAKDRCHALTPYMDEAACLQNMSDTTAARNILDAAGAPPLPMMTSVEKILGLCDVGSMLTADQLEQIAQFAGACSRMLSYLKRADDALDGCHVAAYRASFADLSEIRTTIEGCIRNNQIEDGASPALRDFRRKIQHAQTSVTDRLQTMLRNNKKWFSDTYIVQKNGRSVLPVKKEYKSQFPGTVVEHSASGGTCFMEPSSVTKLQLQLDALRIEEDSEMRRILYMLTDKVAIEAANIRQNMEVMETLDFIFAKAKLSADMAALEPEITISRHIRILAGRHPLLNEDSCVPLDFDMADSVRGVIVTGPNTGGKTVAMKTIGLLSMMAQSGLHVPAAKGTKLAMHNNYLCDIGDGQSISENLSTFSGHIKNVIQILELVDANSLVLIDELGSGTDPAEGMGIAVAVLAELRQRGCLFIVTTHYTQVKDYAESADNLLTARMAFDRETLSPLYRLELGLSGESCALFIAQKMGLSKKILKRAYEEAYKMPNKQTIPVQTPDFMPSLGQEAVGTTQDIIPKSTAKPQIRAKEHHVDGLGHAAKFQIGDSVTVYPERLTGIIYAVADEKGVIGVQIKGQKKMVNHKRLKLQVAASELYPPDYDFSIIFDSVENRKARHQMSKGHQPNLTITT